ncbi:hypothetical protein [Streptomyces sp. SID3343]|uniref:hypothetical protein n=1 Tax=Streptomyces sp. SID3343 TaxID=2690260 RepID=UPI00136F7D35|nr:hypothetical protein [Streptomyces sp. SID3343]MYW00047.1 hypothetical protein [Streptomyces sp. SID3343]
MNQHARYQVPVVIAGPETNSQPPRVGVLDRIRILFTGRMGNRLAVAVADRADADLHALTTVLRSRTEYLGHVTDALVASVVYGDAAREDDRRTFAATVAELASDADILRYELRQTIEELQDAKASSGPCGWADVMVESSVTDQVRRGLDATVSTDVARGRVALRIVTQHLNGVLADGTPDLRLVALAELLGVDLPAGVVSDPWGVQR